MRRRLPLAAFLVCLLAPGTLRSQTTVPTAVAPDTALERKVREVASLLRCPVCLNLSIQDSPSELARDMRDVVRDRFKRGETEDQVFAYFVQRYGEWVLMKPPAHGVSLLVWLLPAVLVIGGVAAIILAVQRWIRNSAPATAAIVEDVPAEDLQKVREALAKERERLD